MNTPEEKQKFSPKQIVLIILALLITIVPIVFMIMNESRANTENDWQSYFMFISPNIGALTFAYVFFVDIPKNKKKNPEQN